MLCPPTRSRSFQSTYPPCILTQPSRKVGSSFDVGLQRVVSVLSVVSRDRQRSRFSAHAQSAHSCPLVRISPLYASNYARDGVIEETYLSASVDLISAASPAGTQACKLYSQEQGP